MDIKINNYYYLMAGVLAILFAVTHAWNGQYVVLPTLVVTDMLMDTQIIFKYVWHIITAENLVFGIVFMIQRAIEAPTCCMDDCDTSACSSDGYSRRYGIL